MAIWVNSLSPQPAIGEPGTRAAARTSVMTGESTATSSSGSTSVDQSSSVTLFHCDAFALS